VDVKMVAKGKVVISLDEKIGLINPNIYGQFIEHIGELVYPGVWVGEESDVSNDKGIREDLLKALKKINPPVIRWPGGCFADSYHWKDGIGPRKDRPRRVNLWGEEPNEFGTHEFLYLCKKVKAEPYICLNVGSGSPEEAFSWVEYCNYGGDSYYTRIRAKNGHPKPFRVKYWGIGNETWGCGGCFKPREYGAEYRRFASYIKRFALPSSKDWCEVELVACGHTSRDWNYKFMEELKDHIQFVDHLSFHYYFGNAGDDVKFTSDEYYALLMQVQELEYQIQQTLSVVDFFAEGRKHIGIVIDEWGSWHPQATLENKFRQQNSLRDAILAACVLNLFNRYSKHVFMSNISMLVNVLHSLFLTSGSRMITTPTYHVYDMYKEHMGNNALRADVSCPIVKEAPPSPKSFIVDLPKRESKPMLFLNVSASTNIEENQLILTLVNQSFDEEIETEISLIGSKRMNEGKVTVLTNRDARAFNDFEAPNRVKPTQEMLSVKHAGITYVAPPHSINSLKILLI